MVGTTGTLRQVRHNGNMVIKDVPNEKRQEIVLFLTLRCDHDVDYKLMHGTVNEATSECNKSHQTVWRFWNRALACLRRGTAIDVSNRKIGTAGRKRTSF